MFLKELNDYIFTKPIKTKKIFEFFMVEIIKRKLLFVSVINVDKTLPMYFLHLFCGNRYNMILSLWLLLFIIIMVCVFEK